MLVRTLLIWLFCLSPFCSTSQQKEVIHSPIDVKVDSVMSLVNNPTVAKGTTSQQWQKKCEQWFAPSGYVVLIRANKTEKWIPAATFLGSRPAGIRYEMQSVKVIHFQNIKKIKEGEYSSQASIYFDVQNFENHLPVTKSISKVTIPLTQIPAATDYWQIYELRLVEVPSRLSAKPHP
ncbi:hypothetical protein [Siphonobacter sp. SORGH_AS_1065]|uniref:hypothetical protein n=1 Tax=Siphonobacter sp. SORGH_AS_1065 TaxID=3041795 RepID=UPI00278433B5|nr:hypothetical protein [Siphonobacter sp. SORGH_AS_1065]MDQ1089706.1 hypothetical protein [Siphonobacter sp. SORGH_AS_1065]